MGVPSPLSNLSSASNNVDDPVWRAQALEEEGNFSVNEIIIKLPYVLVVVCRRGMICFDLIGFELLTLIENSL